MIQGPLHDDDSTTVTPFHVHVADENDTVVLRCRVNCQEHGAYYTPHIRIITTKDGEYYDHRVDNLFNTAKSPRDNICNTANPIRDYEFRLTALSNKMNESIATCVLFYQSISENFTDACYTPSLAWIILPDRPTTMPPTTTSTPTTTITTTDTTTPDVTTTMSPPTTNGPTTKTTTADTETISTDYPAPTFGRIQNDIFPDSVSFTFIIAVVIVILIVVLIVVVWVLYKKFSKTRKRKLSIQPSEDDRSVVIQAHGGHYNCQDIEENDSVDDDKIEQQTTSTVKLRKAQS